MKRPLLWQFFLASSLLLPSLSSAFAQEKSGAYEGPREKLHVYLLIGQSNMAGRAPFNEEQSTRIPSGFLLDSNDRFVPAANPLNRFSTIRKNLGMQKMNPGYSFCKTILKRQPGIAIGLVVNAKGGSRIEEWGPETRFYKEALRRCRAASRTGVLKGILWHQGEGNAGQPEQYLPQLIQLVKNFRRDLKSPSLPFVAGQIRGKEKINDVIAKLPQNLPATAVASSQGLTTFDQWHFDSRSMQLLGERYAEEMLKLHQPSRPTTKGIDALGTRRNFTFAGRPAFVMMPAGVKQTNDLPWVWYAPTLGKNLPGSAEKWMFDRFHQKGIAIAGINVGESYGSPDGSRIYQAFYQHMTKESGFHSKPVLLARSRGGLMLYSWACDHPQSVGGVAGIYPVCNLESYPGLARAAGAYRLSPGELEKDLQKFNPIDRIDSLALAKVPVFHIHGDSDRVVPLEANSAIVKQKYEKLGGPVEIEVVRGQGHNMWSGWFTSEKLVHFVIKNAIPNQAKKSPKR